MEMDKLGKLEKNLLILGIFLCMELGLLVGGEFFVAMPKIIAELGGVEYYALVFTANLAASAIISLLAGKLSDIVGRRRLLLIGIAIIFGSEVVTGFVQNIYQLMAMRALQGLGGSATVVIGLIVISDIFPPAVRAKYLGYYGSLNALTGIISPIVGGFFVQYMSWRWVFYSILPIGVIGILLVVRYMPVIPKTKETKIDYAGIIFFSIAILMLVAITTWGGKPYPWGSPIMLSMYVVMAAAIVLFLLVEKRGSNPVMPMRLFKSTEFTICFISIFLFIAVGMGLLIYLPLYWQKVMGLSPMQSGSFISYRGIVAVVSATVSGLIVARLRNYKWNALAATLIYLGVVAAYANMTTQTSMTVLMLIAFVWGLAGGVITSIFHTGVQMTLPNEDIPVAMGLMQLGVTLGATVASTIFGVIMKNPVLAVGVMNVVKVCLALSVVVLVLVLVLVLRKGKGAVSTESSSGA